MARLPDPDVLAQEIVDRRYADGIGAVLGGEWRVEG